MSQSPNPRFAALKMLLAVIDEGRSLSRVLPPGLAQFEQKRDRAFCQNLVMGTLRWHNQLAAIRDRLLKKPLKPKDEDVNQLILLGLFELRHADTPSHAAVSETVALVKKLKKPWARGLVNAVLRRDQREAATLDSWIAEQPALKHAHPEWLVARLQSAYPDHWESVLSANNLPAPQTLRINRLAVRREDYARTLADQGIVAHPHPHAPDALVLESNQVIPRLPGFEEGHFSVQDASAQLAAPLLGPLPGERVLDACAAPGGKTTHLQEWADNQLHCLALEKAPERMERLSENLHRLQLDAQLENGDAGCPDDWWDGQPFDRILLDAPCSGTGIIRRQPDIKWHRTTEDIAQLVQTQQRLLQALWPLLKPGGTLVYATCSVLPEENGEQIQAFVEQTPNAHLLPLEVEWGLTQPLPGRQILPGQPQAPDMDGFYYARLKKSAANV
ncbi:16S rRNA (cytosine(967)-C(5))-methyltransferase RsmB [Hydrogenovibrio halophilus]|uniref:16S rRNA (cytosine(967)-C(5))-methyltransferase RsmB n=1 Tax=Hydrogenovibrio halophilus TaxID=373391 RepID=UPI000381B529|nr:16S rRNA (cytosine(967)-C(5))-methyltransferase RsmB [Hydrogenovibrio halophilus]